MTVGETTTLKATVEPATATNKAVTWSSNKESVATVAVKENGECEVKGMSAGTATITVTTEDGKKTATCTVTVEKSLESAKAEFTTLLSKYAVKDQNTLTTTYATMLPVVEKAEDLTKLAPGAMYVEKANVAAFNTAINNAYNVLSNPNSDITAIENAKTAFNNAVSTLVKTTPGAVTLL